MTTPESCIQCAFILFMASNNTDDLIVSLTVMLGMGLFFWKVLTNRK